MIDPQNEDAKLKRLVDLKVYDRDYESLIHRNGTETMRQNVDSAEHLVPYADPWSTRRTGRKSPAIASVTTGNTVRIAGGINGGGHRRQGHRQRPATGTGAQNAGETYNRRSGSLNGGTVTLGSPNGQFTAGAGTSVSSGVVELGGLNADSFQSRDIKSGNVIVDNGTVNSGNQFFHQVAMNNGTNSAYTVAMGVLLDGAHS